LGEERDHPERNERLWTINLKAIEARSKGSPKFFKWRETGYENVVS
jgi:hypothetical protein